MLQDNPLLAQLKQQLHAQTPRAEGTVKATDRGFGFLEVDAQKSYFIPPPQMKKVMHGDKIVAAIRSDKDREFVEPETLLEPFLNRFIGRIQRNGQKLFILCDHPQIKDAIACRPAKDLRQPLNDGDWVVATMLSHPLKEQRPFFAEISQFVTEADDHFAPWWVTLARHNLPREAPQSLETTMAEQALSRQDLTALPFVTIDSASTEDMDDALYACETADGQLQLIVAIADPSAWITPGSELDNLAKSRQFTNYLPGFNIPMLPRNISDDLCSLRPAQPRQVLACRITFDEQGNSLDNGEFFLATICSKARLVYDEVSDWLEQIAGWQPPDEEIAQQIRLLARICQLRCQWREQYALVFKDRPDYRFMLNDRGDVLEIVTEQRRTANRIVEEAMIASNICAARLLRDKLGFAIFNTHAGFDAASRDSLLALLAANGIAIPAEQLFSLDGFCRLRRELERNHSAFLDSRVRRFQTFANISISPQPHFGLGLEVYATWTSPLRKYGDLINHRLLKALINNETPARPEEALPALMLERRKLNRMAERDVSDWLYVRYLNERQASNPRYQAEIIDISRGGMRVRLQEIGAVAFIPASFLHPVRDAIICSQENGTVQINGQTVYQLADSLDVRIEEIRSESRSIIVRPLA